MDEIKQEVQVGSRKVIKISKKRFKITIVIVVIFLILLALGTFSVLTRTLGVGRVGKSMNNVNILPSLPSDMMESSIPDNYYGRGSEQPSISDTREFLKTGYNATIKTRNVSDVVKDVKNIVKGSDGRVDNSNSSEKYGYVSFVVPKSNFDTFKDEMESITHKKLYTESISEQNLLSQKQGIEEQTGNIVNTLENLQNQKTALASKHAQTISTINKELARLKTELTSLRAVISETTDPQVLAQLRIQENSLLKQESTQKQNLASENSSYAIQSQNLENSINKSNNNLTNVNKQDSQFTDNIETVNGYVSVNWVSLWQMAKIFSPISPTIIIIILVILIGFYLNHKKKIPKVEFV